MSKTTSVQNYLPAKIEFVSSHKPNLQDGNYTIEIEETIQSNNGAILPQTYKTTSEFAVFGERFSINPQEIKSVFPPAASLGEHSNALPSVVINRSTLPWERSAIEDNTDLPWLILLLFDEDDAKKIKTQSMTLAQLKQTPTNQ